MFMLKLISTLFSLAKVSGSGLLFRNSNGSITIKNCNSQYFDLLPSGGAGNIDLYYLSNDFTTINLTNTNRETASISLSTSLNRGVVSVRNISQSLKKIHVSGTNTVLDVEPGTGYAFELIRVTSNIDDSTQYHVSWTTKLEEVI